MAFGLRRAGEGYASAHSLNNERNHIKIPYLMACVFGAVVKATLIPGGTITEQVFMMLYRGPYPVLGFTKRSSNEAFSVDARDLPG